MRATPLSVVSIYIIRCSYFVGVARLVGLLPRVADFARNPGLGKRNSITFPRRNAPRR